MARDVTGQSNAVPAVSLLALALGAAAFGAVAIGALAIGRLVVGRLVIKKARFGALVVDELTVRKLRVFEHDASRSHERSDVPFNTSSAADIDRHAPADFETCISAGDIPKAGAIGVARFYMSGLARLRGDRRR